MNNKEILTKYKRCLYEYTNAAGLFELSEDGEEMEMPQGGAPEGEMAPDAGADMGGAMPGPEGEAQMGGEMPMDPGMGAEGGAGVEGFNPEGQEQPMDGMGAEADGMNPEMDGEMPMGDTMQPNDEVIDVDDLTQSQESAEKKIDAMNAKFEKLQDNACKTQYDTCLFKKICSLFHVVCQSDTRKITSSLFFIRYFSRANFSRFSTLDFSSLVSRMLFSISFL